MIIICLCYLYIFINLIHIEKYYMNKKKYRGLNVEKIIIFRINKKPPPDKEMYADVFHGLNIIF